jgi:hypothetical protein
MQIKVVERAQQILVQEQEITRKDRELDANIKKPAEAEKYKLEKLAEADRWVSPIVILCHLLNFKIWWVFLPEI